MATTKQTWAIFCATGLDVRHLDLDVNRASMIISDIKDGKDVTEELLKMGAKGTPKKPKQDFESIWSEAHKVGMEAGQNAICTPMVVVERANPLDDNSEIVKQYAPVMDGPCGFAWINVPGNSGFGKWAKAKGLARKAYPQGLNIWVSLFNQSITRKEAYAYAAAEVLNKHGIKAYAGSRMD
jgi:hypothetical protein